MVTAARRSVAPRDYIILDEVRCYIREVIDMRDQESNIVWVQPLALRDTQQVLNEHGLYWFPAKYQQAPNYLGFYWSGRLQELRHVEEYEIVAQAQTSPLLSKAGRQEVFSVPHYVFRLGADFGPNPGPRTGRIFAAGGPPKKCMLHTLFTCETIGQAVAETKVLMGGRLAAA